jgi:hypothetical protein
MSKRSAAAPQKAGGRLNALVPRSAGGGVTRPVKPIGPTNRFPAHAPPDGPTAAASMKKELAPGVHAFTQRQPANVKTDGSADRRAGEYWRRNHRGRQPPRRPPRTTKVFSTPGGRMPFPFFPTYRKTTAPRRKLRPRRCTIESDRIANSLNHALVTATPPKRKPADYRNSGSPRV